MKQRHQSVLGPPVFLTLPLPSPNPIAEAPSCEPVVGRVILGFPPSPARYAAASGDSASASSAVRRHQQDRDAKFRLLFMNNPKPMWVYDQHTLHFLEVNDAAVEKYGYSRAEFLSLQTKQICFEEASPNLHEGVDQVGGEMPPVQWQHLLKDGRVIDVEIASHALMFAGRLAELVMVRGTTKQRESIGFAELKANTATNLHKNRPEHRSEIRAEIRVNTRVPLRLRGTGPNAAPFEELAETENVSASGFLCRCSRPLVKDTQLEVLLISDGRERYVGRARVLRENPKTGPWLLYGCRFEE